MDSLGESEGWEWLSYGQWLLCEPSPMETAKCAADLEVRTCGRLKATSTPWTTLQLLALSGQAGRGVEIYEAFMRPDKRPVIPPENKRFAANHLDAMYVICRYLEGEADLLPWAQAVCQRYVQRIRTWRMLDDKFHGRHWLAWLRLWQAHFGGPQEIVELAAAVRPA